MLRAAPAHTVPYERRRSEERFLHCAVREHLETFLAQVEAKTGTGLPEFVKDEFDLGADGARTACEARPAQCRRYHSTDVDFCKAFYATHDDTIDAAMRQAVAHNADGIITQGRHAVRAAGLDDARVDMNLASPDALGNPKAWRRWRDGKKPFVGS